MKILYDLIIGYSTSRIPYIWGGNNPLQGMDCSGYVLELLTSIGKYPQGHDTTAQGLYNHYLPRSLKIDPNTSNPQLGDLAFYGSNTSEIGHIAICVNKDLISEAGGGNKSTKTEEIAKKKGALVRIRPLDNRSDLVAILRPKDF